MEDSLQRPGREGSLQKGDSWLETTPGSIPPTRYEAVNQQSGHRELARFILGKSKDGLETALGKGYKPLSLESLMWLING